MKKSVQREYVWKAMRLFDYIFSARIKRPCMFCNLAFLRFKVALSYFSSLLSAKVHETYRVGVCIVCLIVLKSIGTMQTDCRPPLNALNDCKELKGP